MRVPRGFRPEKSQGILSPGILSPGIESPVDKPGEIWYSITCKENNFTDKGAQAVAKDLEISFLLDFYGDMLTEKQREMIEYYYNDDLSLSEIAENQGITRQGVRDAIMRAQGQLKEMEERLGLARRFHRMRDGLSQICDAAVAIEGYNEQAGSIAAISEQVGLILQIAQQLCEEEEQGTGE